ncbi:Flagellar basal-body rod protein FlgG [hydrothermal vent metagenome]|uniref:Flagellar basal-body rod protein FlgG n=1 Tax=hydrothermal vent metagenome TaxID=652676 RepID=A0A3B1A0E0_9ZZZZ
MNPALWVSKTGLEAQQNRLTVISNNLANVGTTGFKRNRAVFEDLLYQNVRQVGAQTSQDTTLPSGLSYGTGVRTVATEKLHTQGNILQTNIDLDIAVSGRGYFQISMPDGSISYSRDGSFRLDAEGQVVTSNGYPLSPAINVPADAQTISIGRDGTVSVQQQGVAASTQIGSIQLADFVNPTGLQAKGENLYVETSASGAAQTGNPDANGLGSLLQGSLESSNVNVVEELVGMIEAQRAYEMNTKAITTADQMLQFITNNV